MTKVFKKNAVIIFVNRRDESFTVRKYTNGGVFVITKNMHLDMENDLALEELQEELDGIKLMFNEKKCFKQRKKEKKFKNKLCWE